MERCAIADLIDMFEKESKGKKICYIRWNDTVVESEDFLFQIDLGPCASVVLVGQDPAHKVWIGINHLFKSREENTDMALVHVSTLRDKLIDKNVGDIHCLGLFGAGYQEKSLAKHVARKNIMTIIEALSIFDLNIEIFETGYSQGVSICKSQSRKSFLIRLQNLTTREINVHEVPLAKFFGAAD